MVHSMISLNHAATRSPADTFDKVGKLLTGIIIGSIRMDMYMSLVKKIVATHHAFGRFPAL